MLNKEIDDIVKAKIEADAIESATSLARTVAAYYAALVEEDVPNEDAVMLAGMFQTIMIQTARQVGGA